MQKIINKQKAPKDIVLNKILQEIGEENGVVVAPKVEAPQAKRKKQKKTNWKKIFFNLLIMLVILLFTFLIYIIITDKKEHTLQHKVVKPLHKVSKIAPKPDIKKKPVKQTTKVIQKPVPKKKKLTEKEKKALEHQKAKASLLQQMKN